MKDFAPVLIPTLNRYVHFKNCVESLATCKFADQTDLYIALDYPLNESHWEGYEKISGYLDEIKGFKSVNIFRREENFGVRKNLNAARNEIFKIHEKIIMTEDDNVFAPDFLSFINEGLEVYKDRKDIFSINGYQYPLKMPRNYYKDIYISQGFNAWGYGIWKDRWEKVNWDITNLKLFIQDKEQLRVLNNKNHVSSLKKIIRTGQITGDVFIGYHLFVNNMYSVFPSITRVKNNGFDGSGIHGGNNSALRKKYSNQAISDGNFTCLFLPDILPDQDVISRIDKYFKPSIIKKIMDNPQLVAKKIANLFRINQ